MPIWVSYEPSTVGFIFTHFACQNLYYDCSQYGMDVENEESDEEFDDDESDEPDEEELDDEESDKSDEEDLHDDESDKSDEEELDDEESDKSDEEELHDDESDGDETDVEDNSGRFSYGRFGRRVIPKYRIRLKHKISRHGYGVYPKYGIIRFLGKLRRKGRYYNRVKQRKIRKAHRKAKKLSKKIRRLQRKIRRVGYPKVPQRYIRFY